MRTDRAAAYGPALPRPPRAVLFDLDDTLYPERQFVDGGFRAVARFLSGRSGRSAEELTARLWELHARDGRGRLFDTLLDELGAGHDPDLVLSCLLSYRTHEAQLVPFSGATDVLDALRAEGIRTGLLSDGLSSVQRHKLEGLPSLGHRLDLIVLTDELGPPYAKPSPVAFRVACRLLEVPPAMTIYVANDPRKDFRGAREAELFTIRLGLLPDEGASVDIRTGGADDADVAVDSFASLSGLLLGGPAHAGDMRAMR